MFCVLQIVTVFLAAVSMSMVLTHALEFPGKMRLDKDTYLAAQTIYCPGFTIGVPLNRRAFATLILLFMTGTNHSAFW